MQQRTVLILGNYDSDSSLHLATRDAIRHAASAARIVANTRWMGPDEVLLYPGLVAESHGVVLAPPAQRLHRVLPTALLGALRVVRERDLPFLATGEAHGLVLIEIARNLLGIEHASGVCFEDDPSDPVLHPLQAGDEAGQRTGRLRELALVPVEGSRGPDLYGGAEQVRELTDVANGLNPDYAGALEGAGLRPALVGADDRRPWLHVLEGLRFHATAAFLPQLSSASGAPHPLFRALVSAGLGGDR